MSNFKCVLPRLGMQPVATVSTVQNHPLGTIIQAVDIASTNYGEAEFIYLKGATSTAEKTWVTYNMDDGTTTLIAANAIGPVAIAMSANDATTKFGWYQISGKALGLCATSFADNGKVYIASSGVIDDASVAGDLVVNAKGGSTTTAASGFAEFEISRPWVNDAMP